MLRLLHLLGLLIALGLGWLAGAKIVRRYIHFPTPWFVVQFLDSPLRCKVQPPEQVVGWLDVGEGMQVLEVGPGPGTFTFEAARRVAQQATSMP